MRPAPIPRALGPTLLLVGLCTAPAAPRSSADTGRVSALAAGAADAAADKTTMASSGAEPRILRVESEGELRRLSASEQGALFEEYVTTEREALARGQLERARDLAEQAARLFPGLRRPWLHLAAARLRLEQWGPAIEAARRAEAAADDGYGPVETDAESRAAPAYWEGVALYRTQRCNEALQRLRAARERAPRWAEAARALGEASFVAGDTKAAEVAYAAAFQLDPQVGGGADLAYYGEALAAKGDLEGGVAALQEALRRSPYEPGLHAKLGDLLRREGDSTEAYYQFLLELVVQGPEGLFSPPALRASNEILARARAAPKDPASHELLDISSGFALVNRGKTAQAIRDVEHALQLTRTATGVPHLLLADAYLRQGKLDRSRQELELLLGRDPDFVPALVSLSELYGKLGKTQEAEETLARARAIFPEYWKLHLSRSNE